MKTLARQVKRGQQPEPPRMIAKVFSGERHDIGSKFGFLRANIIEGLKHPQPGEALRTFLKELDL